MLPSEVAELFAYESECEERVRDLLSRGLIDQYSDAFWGPLLFIAARAGYLGVLTQLLEHPSGGPTLLLSSKAQDECRKEHVQVFWEAKKIEVLQRDEALVQHLPAGLGDLVAKYYGSRVKAP